MQPLISIIMGSTSDLPIMEKAAKFLDEMEVPFEINALSAHRTPNEVEAFAQGAAARGLKVIIAGAGMAAALPGVIAASTTLPRNRCPHQRHVRWFRCPLVYRTNAAGHPRGYGGRQWCAKCRYPGFGDAGFERYRFSRAPPPPQKRTQKIRL